MCYYKSYRFKIRNIDENFSNICENISNQDISSRNTVILLCQFNNTFIAS